MSWSAIKHWFLWRFSKRYRISVLLFWSNSSAQYGDWIVTTTQGEVNKAVRAVGPMNKIN